MYFELLIAQREFQIRNAKMNTWQEVEGITVQVPNVIDRAVMALRALLVNHTPKPRQTNTVTVRSGAVAR
jgi:hypothetical protein